MGISSNQCLMVHINVQDVFPFQFVVLSVLIDKDTSLLPLFMFCAFDIFLLYIYFSPSKVGKRGLSSLWKGKDVQVLRLPY